ncbi:thioesterase domain-containing protein [Kibdelosporangium philippinense]|uniref:Thioesterase domain-containing protein n=1 Tax=Kibdelosporangium philippinense TaxID=211113 RepID=A0ABS8Z555_9PSEU|nr:thioesterase domain-containing protein [Kibdelosporangium philippinense]MCE7003036.1 thioesterase domain-containing protein [Kibdelosporangium philippinense]
MSTLAEKRRALLLLRLQQKQAVEQDVSPVVPLKPTGTRPALLLVHAAGGSVAPYAALAGLLGDDQPVFGLEDPGLNGGAAERKLPEIAAEYLAAVRAVQPEGPLYLGGWSVGGAVALEMARQDQDVALVVALDTAFVDASIDSEGDGEVCPGGASGVGARGACLHGDEDGPGAGFGADVGAHGDDDELRAAFAADIAGMGAELSEAELAERFPVFAANVRAFLAYHPSHVDARVVLLCAEDSEPAYLDRWRAYSDEIHVVPGNHYTILQPPNIEALAQALRTSLSEVSKR